MRYGPWPTRDSNAHGTWVWIAVHLAVMRGGSPAGGLASQFSVLSASPLTPMVTVATLC